MKVTALVAVYPIGQQNYASVDAAIDVLRESGLEVQVFPTHSTVTGDIDALFAGLKAAYQKAAKYGGTIMTATVTNICPDMSRYEG